MKTFCIRLRRGMDLLEAIRHTVRENRIDAGVVLSGVGCLTQACLRDASGVTIQKIAAPCEIVSLTGTVSPVRCHLHMSVSLEDLSTLGGHLMPGCLVQTTCELVIGVLPEWEFAVEWDEETGYDEIVFRKLSEIP